MSPFLEFLRYRKLKTRGEYIEALIAREGSIHKAAKAYGMDRTNFRRARRESRNLPQLTPAAAKFTKMAWPVEPSLMELLYDTDKMTASASEPR